MDDKIASLILIGTLLIVFSYYGFLELAATTTPTGEAVKLLTNSTVMFVLGVILVIIAIYLFSRELFRMHNAKTVNTLSKIIRSSTKPEKKVVRKAKKVKKSRKKKKKAKKKPKKRARRRSRRR